MDAIGDPSTYNPADAPLTTDEIAPLLANLVAPDSELRTASLSALVTLSLTTDAWRAVTEALEPLLQATAEPDPALALAAVNVPSPRIRALLHGLIESTAEPARRRDLVHALDQSDRVGARPPVLPTPPEVDSSNPETVGAAADGSHDTVPPGQEQAADSALLDRALGIRDYLLDAFPLYEYMSADELAPLAYLPPGESASLVSHLWKQLANLVAAQRQGETTPRVDYGTMIGGGNILVSMVHALGSGYVPEIEPLFQSFALAHDDVQLGDYIGWTVSRGGLRPVILALEPRLGSDDITVRLASTRLIELAGASAGEAGPRDFGGRGAALEDMFSAAPSAEISAGSAARTKPPPTSSGPDFDLGSISFGLPASAAPAGGEAHRATTSTSPPRPETPGQGPQPAGDPGAVTDPPRTAHAHLQCPGVVAAGKEFALEVGLAETQSPGSVGNELVRPSWSQGPYVITVWVLADGFRLRTGESSRQYLAVTVEEPYPFVELHLTPDDQATDVVHRKIEVTYFIGSQPIGITYRNVEVARDAAIIAATKPPPHPLAATFRIQADFTEPDLTVKISEGDNPGDLHWTFETPRASNVATPAEPIRTRVGGNPGEFAKQLIGRMNQSAGKALSLQMRGIGRTVGQAMPARFWDILASVAAQAGGRAPTLLLISQDPYVPWELAHVESPIDHKSAPFLGAQTVLGRWILPRIGHDKPALPVQDAREAGSMAILCGVYPEQRGRWKRLEHAEQEAADLKERYEGLQVVADTSSVVDFLEHPPNAEVFHFAGHAIYDPTSLENGLVLNDGAYLDATLISGAELAPNPRPFVFLNACQAGSGYEVLGGYAGLVGAFVVAGASAVVAPLWSVNDAEARKVSHEFYAQAVEGEVPAAEVIRRQRARFGKDDNGADVAPVTAVHLAYQYFGHPDMRLIRKQS